MSLLRSLTGKLRDTGSGGGSIATVSQSLRDDGCRDEIEFWREFCQSERFVENFCTREPNPEIDQDVELFIKGYAVVQNGHGKVPKVLDIGSGPVSMLSRSFVGEQVELHAADPLADDYLQLWDSSKYTGLVLPAACPVEELSQKFGIEEFDITHIRNALDHVANPLVGLDEMLKVTKPGGFLIVHGFANEAVAEKWQGFHQWNLCWAEGNDFTISGRGGVTHSLAKFFGQRARIMRPWMRFPKDTKPWCGFIAQKAAAGPKRASLRQEVQTGDERPTNVATLLANEFGSDKGDLHHGRHHYTRVYSEYFEPIRYRSLRVLELGLLHISDPGWDDPSRRDQGGTIGRRAPSMEMWARYFPNSEIVGFDINEFQDLKIERCTILRGDMSNRRELGRVLDFGPFDIIIDDASHASHHQQIALGFLFPHLALGGTYWIEDLNDQPPALEIPGIAKTKALLTQLEITGKFPSDWLSPDEISALESSISTIEFYDSMQSGARHYRDNLAVLTKK